MEFWGFVDFDLKIKNIIPGCLCKLEYGGTEKKGDKEYNIVKLLFNPNKKLDSTKLIEYKRSDFIMRKFVLIFLLVNFLFWFIGFNIFLTWISNLFK